MRLGLDASEAEDVAQETLVEFVAAYQGGRYDRSRGRLSSWIISIAQHRISRRRLSVARAAGRRAESALVHLRDPARLTAVWQDEQQRLILIRAMDLLQAGRTAEPTLRAFDLLGVRQPYLVMEFVQGPSLTEFAIASHP